MNWLIFAIGAIFSAAFSDLFRKLGSNLKDPILSNLIFQFGGFTMAIVLFFLFGRKFDASNPKGIIFALVGGFLISLFTTFTFKALSYGNVSTVIPVIRVGGVLLVAILGVLLFKDKLTWNLILGIILASTGIYLIFTA